MWALPLISAAIAAGAGVLLVVAPIYAIVALAAFAYVGLAIRHTVWAVALLALVSLLEQVPAIAAQEVTLIKLLGVALVSACAIRATVRPVAPIIGSTSRAIPVTAAALGIWSLLSVFWASDSSVAASHALRLAQGIVLMFITLWVVRTNRDAVIVVGGLAAGAIATTTIGFANRGATTTYNDFGTAVPQRFHGVIGDANELGAQLVPAVVFSLILFVGPLDRRWRVVAGVSAALLLAGIAATASRGAAIGLLVALIATPLMIKGVRIRACMAALAGVFASILLVHYVLGTALSNRLTNVSDGGTGRSDLWRVAVRVAIDHPLFGVGSGNFRVVAPLYSGRVHVTRADIVFYEPHVVHNTYLEFFAETGLVGGVLFLLLVWRALRDAARSMGNSSSRATVVLGRGILVATLGYLACLFFISGAYEKQLWILLAVAAALPRLRGSESQ